MPIHTAPADYPLLVGKVHINLLNFLFCFPIWSNTSTGVLNPKLARLRSGRSTWLRPIEVCRKQRVVCSGVGKGEVMEPLTVVCTGCCHLSKHRTPAISMSWR